MGLLADRVGFLPRVQQCHEVYVHYSTRLLFSPIGMPLAHHGIFCIVPTLYHMDWQERVPANGSLVALDAAAAESTKFTWNFSTRGNVSVPPPSQIAKFRRQNRVHFDEINTPPILRVCSRNISKASTSGSRARSSASLARARGLAAAVGVRLSAYITKLRFVSSKQQQEKRPRAVFIRSGEAVPQSRFQPTSNNPTNSRYAMVVVVQCRRIK